jgi:ABC-type transport system substrate-binding protein
MTEGTPKPGGTYRALFGDEVPNLDAAIAFSWADFWASYFLLFNRLYTFNAQNEFVPELAADVPTVSADGKVYTVKLKQGVKFHDGSELTAEDVKFSFDRTLDPALKSPAAGFNVNIAGSDEVASGATKDLAGVKVIDPYTVEFTLKEPQAVFPSILTVTVNGIVPKAAVEAAGADWGVKTVIGTGPFKLSEWAPGEKVAFARNTDYFKTDLPYLDGVELQMKVPDELRVLRWESNEAEFVDGPPGPEVNRIKADPNLAPLLRSEPSPIFDYLTMAANAPQLQDVRVRQAIAMAVDKQALAETYGAGAATVQEGIFTNGIPGFNPEFRSAHQYNPDAAKALIDEVGADKVAGLRIHATEGSAARAQIVQEDLKKIGIELELVLGDFSTYQKEINDGTIQMRWAGYGPDFPDLYPFVTDRFGCKKEPPPPPSAYCNDTLAQIVNDTTSMAVSDPKRLELFQQFEDIVVNQDVVLVPLINRNFISLVGRNVRNAPVYYYLPALEEAWLEQ